jgi:UDP-2,4-diacetamido-2,4,6-trideoxy-beta-L-altropyranose hydrolase
VNKVDGGVLIRADAGGELGSGHVMRMIALGEALMEQGAKVLILSGSCPESLVKRIEASGLAWKGFACPQLGSEADLEATLTELDEGHFQECVLDGYHFSDAYQACIKASGVRLLVVDDYGHAEHTHADLLLNQNPGGESRHYGHGPHVLAGTRYGLLRREFREAAITLASVVEKGRGQSKRRLLVTLGGVDADNVSARVLKLLQTAAGGIPLEVELLLGAANPHEETLQRLVGELTFPVHFHKSVHDVRDLYACVDGVISAGGSTCLEWLLYRRPGCIVILAENQEPLTRSLVAEPGVVSLGWFTELDKEAAAGQLRSWLATSDTPGKRVDGWGALRVAAALRELPFWLRPATMEDAARTLELANDPAVRAQSLNTELKAAGDHVAWLERRIARKDYRIWLGFDTANEAFVGTIRLEWEPEQSAWRISFAVTAAYRGQGMGTRLLKTGMESLVREFPDAGPVVFHATVRIGNSASERVFRKLGFREVEPLHEGTFQFTKEIDVGSVS